MIYRLVLLLLSLSVAAGARPAEPASKQRKSFKSTEDFFIISSIDAGSRRIVLKRPTEVTLVMLVTGQTSYWTEQGRRAQLSDLRAGDTAYIAFIQEPGGGPTALTIKLAPMTVQELQRRYLKRTP